MKTRSIPLCATLVVFTLACVPYETTVVPKWTLIVVNEYSEPLPSKTVRQVWAHNTIELNAGDHEELKLTDGDGYVTFPERKVNASILTRVLAFLKVTILLREHASYGPTSSVTVWGNQGIYKTVFYEPNKALPEKIISPD